MQDLREVGVDFFFIRSFVRQENATETEGESIYNCCPFNDDVRGRSNTREENKRDEDGSEDVAMNMWCDKERHISNAMIIKPVKKVEVSKHKKQG